MPQNFELRIPNKDTGKILVQVKKYYAPDPMSDPMPATYIYHHNFKKYVRVTERSYWSF